MEDNIKIMVVSHERSGTHLTLNSLHENNCANVPTNSFNLINDFLLTYNDSRILKSHHHADWFDDSVFKKYKVIYVKRNLFDTLTSMYFYLNEHTYFGTFDTIENFVWSTPPAEKDDYSFTPQKTFIDRILQHRISYESKPVITVNYETIVNNYDVFKEQMNSLSISVTDTKPNPFDLSLQVVSPRKGIVGDSKNHMSSELIRDITSYVKKEYGYDTVK